MQAIKMNIFTTRDKPVCKIEIARFNGHHDRTCNSIILSIPTNEFPQSKQFPKQEICTNYLQYMAYEKCHDIFLYKNQIIIK